MRKRLTTSDVEKALAHHQPHRLASDGLTRSAVLVLLRDGPDGIEVLLTERSNEVRDHQGQVSFPGGVAEVSDTDDTSTALREATEEIGLDPRRVRLIGRLDDYITITGYHVAPVVAVIETFDGLAPRTREIVSIFAFPLERIGDTRVLKLPGAIFGRSDDVLFVACQDHLVWGATAAMLRNLWEIMNEQSARLT